MTKFLRDTWLLFVAHTRNSLRNVVWVIVGMFQPICYLFLFAPLLSNLAKVPGFPGGGTYNVFTPGLLIMITILGTGLAGFNLIVNLRDGVLERLRVTPVSRLALLLSMVLRDLRHCWCRASCCSAWRCCLVCGPTGRACCCSCRW